MIKLAATLKGLPVRCDATRMTLEIVFMRPVNSDCDSHKILSSIFPQRSFKSGSRIFFSQVSIKLSGIVIYLPTFNFWTWSRPGSYLPLDAAKSRNSFPTIQTHISQLTDSNYPVSRPIYLSGYWNLLIG